MLNVAVVGTGYIGLAHIQAYKSIPDVRVVAIVDKSRKNGIKGMETVGGDCAYYATLEEAAVERKIDIADICLPTSLHEEFVIKAANAKCHVLGEKPVTFDLESFDRMTGACQDNGVYFMVAQVARWWPEFMTIKDYIQQGKLGKVHMIYEKRLAQHPNWAAWHRRPEISGGGLYDINVHDIDFLYSIFGMPCRIYANGWKSPSGCWNHIGTNLSWLDGTQAVVETSLEMTGNFPFSIEFRGCGDKGTLVYSLTAGHNIKDGERGNSFTYYPAGDDTAVLLESEQKDMFAAEISEFINAVKNGTQVPVPPGQSRQVLEIILATKKSLEEGVVVEL
jgi:predicted dehydrogenase